MPKTWPRHWEVECGTVERCLVPAGLKSGPWAEASTPSIAYEGLQVPFYSAIGSLGVEDDCKQKKTDDVKFRQCEALLLC